MDKKPNIFKFILNSPILTWA